MNLNKTIKKYLPVQKALNVKKVTVALCLALFFLSLPFLFKRKEKQQEDKSFKEAIQTNQKTSRTFESLFEKEKTIDKQPEIDENTNNIVLQEQKIQEEFQNQYGFDIYQEATEPAIDNQQYQMELQKLQEEIRRREQLEMQRRHTGLTSLRKSVSNQSQQNQQPAFPDIAIPPLPGYPEEDNNYQKKKTEFLRESAIDEFVLQKPLTPALSPYEVKAGTILPLTLETGINSDIPGQITAIVKNDVYDSKTGRVLLIPSGSRVIGQYSSNVSFGQERVQLVFNRITLPNQKSINIGSMIGVDQMGQSGAKDKVDAKLGKVFGSVIMSAILGAGTAVTTDRNNSDDWESEAGRGAGEQILDVGSNYADKLLNVQPTLTIRPGYTIGMFIGKDLLLEPYER